MCKPHVHTVSNRKGFTLIETLVTIAVFAVAMGALSFLIVYFYRTNAYVFQQTAATESARTGVTRAMTYLREASYGADGSYPIVSAATSSVQFYVDTNGDGTVDKALLELVGTNLRLGLTSPAGNPLSYAGQPTSTSTIATYIRMSTSTPVFTYYDASGNQLTPPINVADVASITTTLTVNINPYRAPNDFTLSVGATLRNLRANP